MFHTIEKTVRSFLKDVEIFLCGMHETLTYQLNIGASIVQFYQESNSEAEEFHKIQQCICKRFWVDCVSCIDCAAFLCILCMTCIKCMHIVLTMSV
jgi:hypothetical protein